MSTAVPEAVRNYKVVDFFDKLELETEGDKYIKARGQASGIPLERAASLQGDNYRFSVSYGEGRFLHRNLAARSARLLCWQSFLTRRLRGLCSSGRHCERALGARGVGDWRQVARSIGEAHYKPLIVHTQLRKGSALLGR